MWINLVRKKIWGFPKTIVTDTENEFFYLNLIVAAIK